MFFFPVYFVQVLFFFELLGGGGGVSFVSFVCLVGPVEFLGREFPNSITVSTKQTKK